MAANTDVQVTYKVYKELNNDLSGIKETAVEKKEGYIYVFRQLTPKEKSNDDGTRTRIYQTVDIKKNGSRDSLPEVMLNNKAAFFFCYSLIKLSENRVESIRKNLNKYITDKNDTHLYSKGEYKNNIPSRVVYIPLTKNSLSSNYVQPIGKSELNVDMSKVGTQNQATIYLHDWITHLQDLTNEYKDKIDSYYEVLNQTRVVSGEEYPVYSLYSFTKTITEVASSKSKYLNNIKEGDVIHSSSRGMREKRPMTRYLSDLDKLIEPKKDECKVVAEKIVNLYIEPSRSVHSSLIDYSFGADEEVDFAESLVGQSLQNNAHFISKDMSKAFGLGVVKKTMLDNAAKFKDIKDFSKLTPEDILEHSGEGDWFTYSFVLGNAKRIVTETPLILDSFLENMPEITKDNMKVLYKYIKDGRYKSLTGMGTIVSTDANRIKGYCRRHNINNLTESEMLGKWKDNMEIIYPDSSVYFEPVDGVKTGIVRQRILKPVDMKTKLSKKFLDAGSEALSNLGNVMDGFNILYQVSAFKDFKDTEEYLIAIASILGSLSGLCSVLIETSIKKSISKAGSSALVRISAGKVTGCIGILFTGIEAGISAVYRFRKNDDDAAGAYVISAISAGAYIVLAIAGVTGAPLLMCLALSILMQFLASYLTDDDIDVFLKYCLWGELYYDVPDTYPAWWPSIEELSSPNNAEQAIILSKPKKELFYNYDDHIPLNPLSFHYSKAGTKNLDYQLMALNNIVSRPPYKLKKGLEMLLVSDFQYANSIHLQLVDVKDILQIESIEVVLSNSRREFFRKTYTPWDNPGNFMNKTNYVDTDKNLQQVNTFRVLFIKSKDNLKKSIKKALSSKHSRSVAVRKYKRKKFTKLNDFLPSYYHKNIEEVKKADRLFPAVKVECNIRYTTPLKRSIKIVKK